MIQTKSLVKLWKIQSASAGLRYGHGKKTVNNMKRTFHKTVNTSERENAQQITVIRKNYWMGYIEYSDTHKKPFNAPFTKYSYDNNVFTKQ